MKYIITFGYAIFTARYEVAGAQNEQDAVDMLADYLESTNQNWAFIPYEDTEDGGGEIMDDVYYICGNHGLCLYHAGNFTITENGTDNDETYVKDLDEEDDRMDGDNNLYNN
jgi:hypothetical protein